MTTALQSTGAYRWICEFLRLLKFLHESCYRGIWSLARQGRISHAFPHHSQRPFQYIPVASNEPGSLRKLLTFLTPYRGIWLFGPIDYRSSLSLSACRLQHNIFCTRPTFSRKASSCTYQLHLPPIICRWPLKNTMAHSLTHSHMVQASQSSADLKYT